MLSMTYYAQNYAGIISWSLLIINYPFMGAQNLHCSAANIIFCSVGISQLRLLTDIKQIKLYNFKNSKSIHPYFI